MHIFVYADHGRWEIRLMQEAIALLQGPQRGDYRDGVAVGRQLFATLPEDNRLVRREQERWSLENQRDECFADMYVHPQEVDYTIDTLFDLINASGLEFIGFSNPSVWDLERLLGKAPELLERTANLSDRQRYRLVELLDPSAITHYEFFLAQPPLPKADWDNDAALLAAIPARHPCIEGWPSQTVFNADYQVVQLQPAEFDFLQACDVNDAAQETVETLIARCGLSLAQVRSLLGQSLLLLTPGVDP